MQAITASLATEDHRIDKLRQQKDRIFVNENKEPPLAIKPEAPSPLARAAGHDSMKNSFVYLGFLDAQPSSSVAGIGSWACRTTVNGYIHIHRKRGVCIQACAPFIC